MINSYRNPTDALAQFVPLNPRPMLQSLYVSSLISKSPTLSLFPFSNTPTFTQPCPQTDLPASHNLRINELVIIRLKWGQTEYKGRLISVDSYMNVQLSGTEEYIDGKSTGSLGQVLIRFVRLFWRCRFDWGLLPRGEERQRIMGKRSEEISTCGTRDTFCSKGFSKKVNSRKRKPTVGKETNLGATPPPPGYLCGFLLSLVLFHHLLTQ